MEINISLDGGKKVNASVDNFTIHTDQSTKSGGEGTAPEPYTLFLASIGACAGVYVLGFCKNRDIPTENITLTQKHSFDQATHTLKKIELEINVPSDFPSKYHEALVRVASKCTVKKTLENPPEFETRTVVK